MIIYIAVITLSILGYALHEFSVNRDLRVAAPGRDRVSMRGRVARLKTRFESVSAGTRLPTRAPTKASPLGLTRRLGTHA